MPTLTITSETGAIISINGTEQSSLTAEAGTAVGWSVFASGKGLRSGSLTLNEDVTLDVKFVSGSFNINFLTNDAFEAMGTPEANGIYAVECDPVIEFFPTKEDVLTGVADGSTWYRLYKSGWLEQGGTVAYGSSAGFNTVNFAKPFMNTAYQVTVSPNQQTLNNGIEWQNFGAKEKHETYFTTFLNQNVKEKDWFACGYAGEIVEDENEDNG